MTAGKYSWDIIVVGSSLEAAFATALLAKRGWTAAWVGAAPSVTVAINGHAVTAAPSLVPSRHFTPALNRVLEELKLLPSNSMLGPAPSWQLLGERLRLSLPRDAVRVPRGAEELETLRTFSSDLVQKMMVPLKLGFFGERAARQRQALMPAFSSAGTIASAVGLVQSLLAVESGTAAQLLAEPNDMAGGVLALTARLQKASAELGVRVFASGLQKRLDALRFGWNEVRCTLASGEELTGRVLLFALPDGDLDALLPEGMATGRFRQRENAPLLRQAFVVRSRGLPAALGRFALLEGERPMWIERQSIDRDREACALFWRSDGSELERQREAAMARFGQIAPFVETYLEAAEGPDPVPLHASTSSDRRWRIARRVLDARGPLVGLSGFEGAAMVGAALAERAMRLAPRKALLR